MCDCLVNFFMQVNVYACRYDMKNRRSEIFPTVNFLVTPTGFKPVTF